VLFTYPALHLNEIVRVIGYKLKEDWKVEVVLGVGQRLVCWAGSSVQNYMTLSHMFTVSLDEGNTCFSTEPFLLLTSYLFVIDDCHDLFLYLNCVCVSLFQINVKHFWIMPR